MVTMQLELMLQKDATGIATAGEQIKASFPGLTAEQSTLIDEAVAELRRREAGLIKLFPVPILSSRRQSRWYLGPRDCASPNWFAYRDHLRRKGWGESAVSSIDEASTRITNELLCPNTGTEGRFQGLVLGYVQSGKTASMAGTIAKAADSGYRMVIILAGLTNILRQQTQRRIEADIIGHNPERWWVGTTEEQDFRLEKGIKLPTLERGKCALLVVKKNAAVLRRLKRAMSQLSELERKGIPTFIIDDECDQASINTAAYRSAVSRINGLIRDICEQLPRVTYVGYTATPYANILMAETSVDGSRDLYPSEFIVSLAEPEGYFGVRKLFADEQGADREAELPYIRRVPDEDASSLQPISRKERDLFAPSLTPSLRTACDYFLLSLAARAHRGQEHQHCCMLIHTTIYAVCHRRLRTLVQNGWLNPLLQDLRTGNGTRNEELRSLWQRESCSLEPKSRIELDCPDEGENFDQLRSHLLSAAESISITVENSESELSQRLDFAGSKALHTIVIGGNVLARGLTIEGLVCSFFIRSTNQYDTLMQMGRWFGYRKGYEDLPRIWITRELDNAFRDLVNVEELIRAEITEITRKGWTPADMAIRVPQLASLSITARNKLVMENLEQCDVSYYGTHEQTIGFPVSNEFHSSNWEAGELLLQEAIRHSGRDPERTGSSLLIPEVNHRPVVRFLRNYNLEKQTMQGICEFVESELDAAEECMESWNIAVIGASGRPSISFGGVEGITLLNRSKINPAYQSPFGGSIEHELRTRIYLKALMGVSDVLVDVDREAYRSWLSGLSDPGFSREKDSWDSVKRYRTHALGKRPLLLLYPIDRASEPRGWNPAKPMEEQSRLPLLSGLECPEQLAQHILGMGIVFPDVTRATARHFIRVKLEKPSEGEIFDESEIQTLENDEDGTG
jgi:hypothetical protein